MKEGSVYDTSPDRSEERREATEFAQLQEGLMRGDAKSFETIFHLFQAKLLAFIKMSLQDTADAEEIVQQVFMKIWLKRELIDPQKSLEAFLYAIAKNEIKDFLRKTLHKKKYLSTLLSETANVHSDVEKTVEFNETKRILNSLIDELPEKRRKVFVLNRMQGKTYRQIAEDLNISENTVDSQMRKALAFLKQRWGEMHVVILIITSFF